MRYKITNLPDLLLIFSFVCLAQGIIFSQTCTICSQADVDNWSSTSGFDIYISGADITNLNNMSMLESLFGKLYIYNNPVLTDISGLANLKQVGSDFRIYNNPQLDNISGLTAYEGTSFICYENNSLDSIMFPSFIFADISGILIRDNPSLKYIGLPALTNANDVEIVNNASLEEIYIPSIAQLDSLIISENTLLKDLDGLEILSSFSEGLSVHDNPSLTFYCGLWNIVANDINVVLDISGNLKNPTNQEILYEGSCGNFVREGIGYSTLTEALNGADDYSFIFAARDIIINDSLVFLGNQNHTLVIRPTTTLTMDAPFTNEGIIINHGILHLINGNPFLNLGSIITTGQLIME